MLCLDLAAAGAPGFLLAGGVFVLEVDVLDTPLLPACFVGLFVGDRIPLRPVLAPGVGLLGTALSLLPGAPTKLCLFSPLVAEPFAAPGFPLPAAVPILPLPAALCCGTTLFTPLSRRNMP